MKFSAAIFDLDGTLLDSMDVWERIDLVFLKKRGLRAPDGFVAELCAKSFLEGARFVVELFGLPDTPMEIIAEWNALAMAEYSEKIELLPHARAYLDRLKNAGIALAVATALPRILFEPCLRNIGIFDYFGACVSTEEVLWGKERPDVFLLAAQRLGKAPADCVVFDDVLPAIRSAKTAGMKAVGVFDKYSAANADEIRSIADGYILDFSAAPMPD